ncbi:uncharacterized protein B0I36DRAFT_256801 [Microdochium trichocladiopsis]|uniref:Uncharacterized protein n=1 Tax=Microdochium trichocladiopsis TaxID=1682393 RepID=A0A9P8XQS8_9PEZI|nr:uncharacterized protein B0I36DRAFT_256801 [Microdochium trichocladiopsis]KAH7012248.1 hypothetical protein B0I36DRAFT_256801 [Microdochium trichocladiopsis]
MATKETPSFVSLPPEIRVQIYQLLLDYDLNGNYSYKHALALFRLSKLINREAKEEFFKLNIFVRVEAVWPEKFVFERHVPIVLKDQQAERFAEHSLSVFITSCNPEPRRPQYSVVLRVGDLDNFILTWLGARLPKERFNVELRLRNRCATAWDETITTERLQRRLLMPFAIFKPRRSLVITGEPTPLPSVTQELHAAQLVRLPTREECLTKATALKATGNEAIGQGDYHNALENYREALDAIYYIIRGGQQYKYYPFTVHGHMMEPWLGRNWQDERERLYHELMANICQVLLKLEHWNKLIEWGTQSISPFRRGGWRPSPEVEAARGQGFPGFISIGKIYYRTALGYKALGDEVEALSLLEVAQVYLPHDKLIREHIQACKELIALRSTQS